MRQHPRCRALEDGEPRHLRLHLGNQLDRRRAGADDGDALAGDLMLVLPACRVEQRAGERIDARNVREARLAERPGPEDEEASRQLSAIRGDAPSSAGVIPRCSGELVLEANVRHDPESSRAVAQVIPDLSLLRVGARPVGLARERERVQMRRHVTHAAGIRVVAPGAPDVPRALQHDEVVDAGLLQADRHAQAGEAAADNHREPVAHCSAPPLSRTRTYPR